MKQSSHKARAHTQTQDDLLKARRALFLLLLHVLGVAVVVAAFGAIWDDGVAGVAVMLLVLLAALS
jgi:membrane glycosyltransferase